MNLSHKGFSMAMSVITRWYLRHLGTGDSCWTPLNSHVDRRKKTWRHNRWISNKNKQIDWLEVWNIFYFSIYPNWLIFFRGLETTNQLSLVWVWTTIYLYTYICMYVYIPSGDLLHSYGKSPCWMGKVTISMAIFNSYVSLPGGYVRIIYIYMYI